MSILGAIKSTGRRHLDQVVLLVGRLLLDHLSFCNTHFVRKSKRRMFLYIHVRYIYLSFHVNTLFENRRLIKVIKWCIMLRLYCVYVVTI
jgi:hypothetical protein